ncbi:MAG: lipase [Mastigocoleus sp. MO_167.B18]|nr:lipase [Mastigocoleus sp. MO_167.B18]
MPLPTVILPGYFESAKSYQKLEQSLKELGFPAVTVPLGRRDWIPTLGGSSFINILQKLDKTVKNVLFEFDVPQINLIGHSAGGWIARIYLGELPYSGRSNDKSLPCNGHKLVANLITLGTPHFSQERWTRRTIDFVNQNYPGAFYKDVNYICVAGKTVFGNKKLGSWLAYNSYLLTCGKGDTWGDGITPIEAAHLEGAQNIVIEDVRHSPKSPQRWYGSPDILSTWANYLN